MTEAVVIQSAHDGTTLTLAEREPRTDARPGAPEYFRVSVTSTSFSGTVRVYAHMGDGLPALFADLARDWRGFDGAKSWSSLEGEFSLCATADKLGHTTLQFALSPPEVEYGWKLEGALEIEAGQLDRIASEVRSFWHGCAL